MPFFVNALNALYSFQFDLVRLWVVLLGAKIMKNGLCKEKKLFFQHNACGYEKNRIFASESPLGGKY